MMNHQRDENSKRSQASIRALQDMADAYVCDALDGDARQAFELELADNQIAREAVARAVELVGLTRSSFAEPKLPAAERIALAEESTPRPARLRWEWALGVGLACVLVLAIVFGTRPAVDKNIKAVTNPDGQLALIWSDVISQPKAAEMPSSPLESVDEGLAEFVDAEPLVADSPDWMLAAVVQLSEQNDMNRELDMENR